MAHPTNYYNASANADNAIATATIAAVAGNYLEAISCTFGYSGAVPANAILTLKDNATTILTIPVKENGQISLDGYVSAGVNTNLSASLSASGSGGNVGYVNLTARHR